MPWASCNCEHSARDVVIVGHWERRQCELMLAKLPPARPPSSIMQPAYQLLRGRLHLALLCSYSWLCLVQSPEAHNEVCLICALNTSMKPMRPSGNRCVWIRRDSTPSWVAVATWLQLSITPPGALPHHKAKLWCGVRLTSRFAMHTQSMGARVTLGVAIKHGR
jgi:hypothetical protein